MLSMYKALNSIRFVEIIKLGLLLFMYKYKEVILPVPMKIYSYNTQIDQIHEIFLFPSREGMSHSHIIIVSRITV